MNNISKFTFPVGYQKFHKKQVFNFQLNRWLSFGYARFEDMKEVGQKIETFADWKTEMEQLAEKAVSENRFMNAAFYYRAAEFYILQDNSEKKRMYDRFIEFFYKAFENDGIERYEVPYQNGFLPAIRIPAAGEKKRGTIIIHGGFDSFMEEFYSWMRFFSDFGYEAIAFEGPGQGAARRKYGLAMDIEWEKPAKAILDHFELKDVTWLGISMGGWFCFRAAAFEPRIKRVIASSIAYDYLKIFNIVIQKMHIAFIKYFKKFTNKVVMKSIKKGRGMDAWQGAQMMYVAKEAIPTDAFEKLFLQMNEKNLHSDMVKQDVLILTGRNDHFIPFRAHDMQIKALTNAKSVTGRVFTKEEQAHNHCQVGNTGLALDVMVKWIDEKS
jgi:pimeloyl-ACP methyl ester carboxylesterase